MRVSTRQQFDQYMRQIQAAHGRYLNAQKEVMTGKRFELASEDPGGAHFVASATALRARTEQLDANLRSAKDYLGNTETVFSEINTLVNKAYTLAVNGANSTYDQEARDGMAKEVAEIQRRLTYLSNTQGGSGQYIFGGHISDAKPFQETPPTLTFSGDDNPVQVEVRPNETMRVNLQGAGTFFTSAYAALETLRTDLMGGDVNRLGNQDLQAMQDVLRQVNNVRGETGTKLQTIENLRAQNERRIDDLVTQVADVQEVDLSEAIVRLQTAETAYQAALQVAARGQSLTLMDYLR